MTSQQLIEARAALWHHNAEPILTLEDAASWVATNGFLLFLPRRQQLRAPSPTFVEACMGRLEHTPARPEIENALSLAYRLFASGEVLPLNLLGTLSEEPDFLIARDRLPLLLSLLADRSWKTAPGGRTSPLNVTVWKLLDEQGELTTDQIRAGVGREVTNASIRRALIDLWSTLRVFPRYHEGEETTWALAKSLCPKECAKGATTAQSAALSLFLADYLRSAIAATEDEAASFLSPLASRSKLREVLHALVATRQLSTIPLGPNTLFYVAGELPEFPEVAPPEVAVESAAGAGQEPEDSAAGGSESGERIRKYTPRGDSRESSQREDRRGNREERPYRRDGEFKPRREGGFRPRGEGEFRPRREGGFAARGDRGFKPQREGGFRAPYRKPRPEAESEFRESDRPERESRFSGEERPRAPFRKSFSGDRRKSFGKDFDRGGERKPYGERKSFGDRKPYGDRPERGGERKSFGDRKPYGRRESSGEGFERGGERRTYGERKPYGERKSYGDRPARDGERKPFGDRKPYGERKSYGDRPARDGERKPFGDRKPYGERKSYGDRPARDGERRPFGDRPRPDFRRERDGEDRPRRESDASDRPPRKSFGKPGGKSFGKGPGKKFGKPSGSGPKRSFGKGGGKSGFSKGPGKSLGKGPGKGFSKGPKRGPGKPRRSE